MFTFKPPPTWWLHSVYLLFCDNGCRVDRLCMVRSWCFEDGVRCLFWEVIKGWSLCLVAVLWTENRPPRAKTTRIGTRNGSMWHYKNAHVLSQRVLGFMATFVPIGGSFATNPNKSPWRQKRSSSSVSIGSESLILTSKNNILKMLH